MRRILFVRPTLLLLFSIAAVLVTPPAEALQPRSEPVGFDALALPEPGSGIAVAVEDAGELPVGDPIRAGWEEFSARNGGWRVWIDSRSGLPALASGVGIAWTERDERDASLDDLERLARAFLEEHRVLLGGWNGSIVLDREASGLLRDATWQVTFRQEVDGVPVDGSRFDFHVSHGRLVAFGTHRWGRVRRDATPAVGVDAARAALDAYLAGSGGTEIVEIEPASLRFLAVDPRGTRGEAWDGPRGEGYRHVLVHRFAFVVPGEPASWVAEVDAATGRVVGLHDETRYGAIVGGVYPVSDDQLCPTGCEQPGWPMPYADFTEGAGAVQTANDQGLYSCSTPGATIRTTLAGPYIRVQDNCGPISETTACDGVLDLRQGPGTDCEVPPGASPGNTHASRSSFYHLNRAMEKGRAWLPENNWLRSRVTDNVNINSTCNAYWNGSVNFYKSGGGCRNTGEIAGVFVHEWGHGLDANDGGNYDNPSEAYADVVAFLETRESCVGRGFFMNQTCSGYGDTCLTCTGIRDQDWAARTRSEPASPAGFLIQNCPGGGAPCGKEEHCEGYLAGETVWDLAVRDLPASGMDAASAWQLAEKLFYLSRKGSGGPAYNCAPPTGNGCGTTSWFHKFRLIDDDDGNLANGTPHAGAIFAAFSRHGIACGLATDASNQSAGSCPALAKPEIAAIPGDGDVQVSWSTVPGAASYTVLRNDIGCDRAQVIVDRVLAPATSAIDGGVSPNLPLYYRVQAVGANPACESAVSDCASTEGQPDAGGVRFARPSYGCSDLLTIKVVDGNASPGLAVTVASDTETLPETVVLTETLPGSQVFVGSIPTLAGAPVAGDGAISVAPGDLLMVTYQDPDTGSGAGSVAYGTAVVDCEPPVISGVEVASIGDESAVVRWTTSKPATGRVDWGPTAALGNTVESSILGTSHALSLVPLDACARYFFRVTSADASGNTGVADVSGAPFAFHANTIPGVLYQHGFESTGGWTLEGEWQIGAPQGKGAGEDDPGDPGVAFKGGSVLGHDLTGLGTHPGDYEAQRTERALSPVLDATGLVQGKLKFRRWLNSYGGVASVKVKKDGVWNIAWTNGSVSPVAENDWSLQTVDIAPWADGNPALQIAFEQNGGPNPLYVRSGWNVDQLLVKAGNVPDYDACGGCGGAPSFAGVRGAVDVDPCGDDGVRVFWDPASAWGTGRTGTYSVYRGTDPSFVPGPANRVATGVAGTSWVDLTAPNDVPVHYLVRAENDETCSSGPANGGVTESNDVRAAVLATTNRSVPGEVSGLGVEVVNTAVVHLTWSASPDAVSYEVYRSAEPSGGWLRLGATDRLVLNDVGAGSDGESWYYTVRPVNACGQEGP